MPRKFQEFVTLSFSIHQWKALALYLCSQWKGVSLFPLPFWLFQTLDPACHGVSIVHELQFSPRQGRTSRRLSSTPLLTTCIAFGYCLHRLFSSWSTKWYGYLKIQSDVNTTCTCWSKQPEISRSFVPVTWMELCRSFDAEEAQCNKFSSQPFCIWGKKAPFVKSYVIGYTTINPDDFKISVKSCWAVFVAPWFHCCSGFPCKLLIVELAHTLQVQLL